jgi:methylated-DNA-[protein]-cysteine S-methyltransferase
MYRHIFACPLGDLLLTATDTLLTGAFFPGQKTIPENTARMSPGADVPVIREAQAQFTAYFAGKLHDFDLPMAPDGTPLQQDVWRLLCDIAFGNRTTYGQITARLGLTREHARAVGTAVGRNPISIAIPRRRCARGLCRRVAAQGRAAPARRTSRAGWTTPAHARRRSPEHAGTAACIKRKSRGQCAHTTPQR